MLYPVIRDRLSNLMMVMMVPQAPDTLQAAPEQHGDQQNSENKTRK